MTVYPDSLTSITVVNNSAYEVRYKPMLEPAAPRLFRVLHDVEIGRIWRAGLPEVHPLYPNHHSNFQRWAQEASYGLNPWLTRARWTDFYHYRFWISNNQGFGMDGDARANFVLMKDLNEELPKVEALVTGGSMIEGERVGDWVKVKGLHYNTPVTLAYLQAHPQYWVRGTYAGGTGQVFRMLGDKYDGPAFIHPLIINRDKGDLFIQAYKVQEWTGAEPPDPLKLYL